MSSNGNLCFSCYDDVTFRMHGYVPEEFRREIKRYTDAIYDGLTIKCSLCDSTVVFNRTDSGKYREDVIASE